jgi:type IV pilus assembly protein PilQ
MKNRISLLLACLLFPLPVALWGQETENPPADAPAATEEPSEAPPRDLGLSRARETIEEVDARFQASQNEVLGTNAEEGSEANADEEGMDEEVGASVGEDEIGAEVDLDLPESIDPNAIDVGDVYMDFGAEERPSVATREEDTISVDFPNTDVRTIIRNVADLYELNVVIPDTLVGSVSLKLRDVTWRQVFDVVLEPMNFTWVEDRNIIKLRSRDELLAEPVATRVFVINFAQAGELQGAISPLVEGGAGGRIQVDNRSNALVITERPSRMNDIQAIIERLDRPTDQVMIESKFVEITRRDQANLGINWSSLSGYEISAGPFERTYERDAGREIDRGTTYVEGTRFDPTTGEFVTAFEDSQENSISYPETISRMDTAVFNADAFNVILSALESNNEVELVSNPTVVTVNNTPAQINIGEEFPIPNYTYNDERGSFEVQGFEYKPIGIILNVTPQVNSAGFITLNIAPEISSRGDTVNFNGANIPIVTTRKTESTVTIKSGFTLAIGGLVQQSTGDTETKVPLLGDIPLLGRLFRSSEKSSDVRNLIIFITAKVLNPDGSTYRDVFSDETLFRMGISERDVPGYEPTPEEQAMYDRVREQRTTLDQIKTESQLREQLEMLERLRLKQQSAADPEAEGEESSSGPRVVPRRNQP